MAMHLRRLLLAIAAIVAMTATAAAEKVLYRNAAVTCYATSARVARMVVEDVRFGYGLAKAWGSARVKLVTARGSVEAYVVSGSAAATRTALRPNGVAPTFSFKDVQCVVRHRNIVSVERCRGGGGNRTCELGLSFFRALYAYTVSLTVMPAAIAAR